MRATRFVVLIVAFCLASPSRASGTQLRLGELAVVSLADAFAKRQGYRLADYIRAKPRYHADIGEWNVMYTPKKPRRTIGDDFSVFIHDRTKKPTLIPGR